MISQKPTSIPTITSFQDFCFYTSQDKPTVIDCYCKVTIPAMARMAKAFPHIRFFNLNIEAEEEDLLKVLDFSGIQSDGTTPRFVVFRKGEKIHTVARADNAVLENFLKTLAPPTVPPAPNPTYECQFHPDTVESGRGHYRFQFSAENEEVVVTPFRNRCISGINEVLSSPLHPGIAIADET